MATARRDADDLPEVQTILVERATAKEARVMGQLPLLDVPTPRRHRRVRDTSVASYAVGRETFIGRKADVLRWLAHYWNARQVSPTSAELAWYQGTQPSSWKRPLFGMERTLYIRRGLSDLQTDGLVETVEKRKCAVTGRTCHTWRITQR